MNFLHRKNDLPGPTSYAISQITTITEKTRQSVISFPPSLYRNNWTYANIMPFPLDCLNIRVSHAPFRGNSSDISSLWTDLNADSCLCEHYRVYRGRTAARRGNRAVSYRETCFPRSARCAPNVRHARRVRSCVRTPTCAPRGIFMSVSAISTVLAPSVELRTSRERTVNWKRQNLLENLTRPVFCPLPGAFSGCGSSIRHGNCRNNQSGDWTRAEFGYGRCSAVNQNRYWIFNERRPYRG